jgi:peroxiredoxin
LLDFERSIGELRKKDIQLIAASCDTLEKARETIKKYGLSFPVGYDLVAREVSEKTGAFYDQKDGFLHATGYLLDPEARITCALYCTRSVGRLGARDSIGWVEYLRGKK